MSEITARAGDTIAANGRTYTVVSVGRLITITRDDGEVRVLSVLAYARMIASVTS